MSWHAGLTEKQRRFVEAHSSNGGNATAAARSAGYKQPLPQGCENLKKPSIQAAIEALRQEVTSEAIASREQRQTFWTEVMRDDGVEMRDRLRASELLGKSQGDFIARLEHSGAGIAPVVFCVPSNGRDPAV